MVSVPPIANAQSCIALPTFLAIDYWSPADSQMAEERVLDSITKLAGLDSQRKAGYCLFTEMRKQWNCSQTGIAHHVRLKATIALHSQSSSNHWSRQTYRTTLMQAWQTLSVSLDPAFTVPKPYMVTFRYLLLNLLFISKLQNLAPGASLVCRRLLLQCQSNSMTYQKHTVACSIHHWGDGRCCHLLLNAHNSATWLIALSECWAVQFQKGFRVELFNMQDQKSWVISR